MLLPGQSLPQKKKKKPPIIQTVLPVAQKLLSSKHFEFEQLQLNVFSRVVPHLGTQSSAMQEIQNHSSSSHHVSKVDFLPTQSSHTVPVKNIRCLL